MNTYKDFIDFEVPQGWDVQEVFIGDELAGVFLVQENEIHCWRREEFKGSWLTRQKLEELTKPLFVKYGEIKTKVRLSNETGHKFIKRLGFKETHRDKNCVYYETERLNHARL